MLSACFASAAFFGGLATAASQNLYASHYSGTLHYLTLSNTSDTAYTLVDTTTTRSGNAQPSWLTIDRANKALYVNDETSTGSSSTLTSFSIGSNGALTQSGKVSAPLGQVASAVYGGANGAGYIANVHYNSGQTSTFKIPLAGQAAIQTLQYTMSGKGANPSRQDGPHPHEAYVDPTGNYLLIPDLGADLIRIYSIAASTGQLTECAAAKTPPGTGPRHLATWIPSTQKFSRVRRGNAAAVSGAIIYSANELGNSVSAWSTSYPAGGCLTLSLLQTLTPYANNASAPSGTKVAEVRVKGNFLYSANRNDKKFSPNDSMSTYAISSTGSLTWVENTSSYGTYPRTFDINEAGDLVAIGDQTTSNVAIVKRDTTSGKLTGQVATLRIGSAGTPENEDGLSAVVWA